MKKAEVVARLERMSASALAGLAGRSLTRGRPSKTLRDELVAAVYAEIAAKRVSVRSDGAIVRRDA